jgi:ubiquitin carboxyl-terminal hydrolase 16
MPDKQLTIATYAAGASLAAIALVYVFAPTYFIDGEGDQSASSRRRGVVGLANPANDCFINSVLQALAGLGDLRLYLIREIHRRDLDGPRVYAQLVEDPVRQNLPAWKIEGLQAGLVTHGLKDILDALNERPLYRKTISATGFVACLEHAFRQRISRQQQDAQEFLQVVAERLCDEYHAGHRARNFARASLNGESMGQSLDEQAVNQKLNGLALEEGHAARETPTIAEPQSTSTPQISVSVEGRDPQNRSVIGSEEEEGFPLEGGSESQIECSSCGFKPKPTTTTFCSLTLSVPQVNSTSLSSCFDQMFKTETIEGFKCEKCRLVHASDTFKNEYAKSNSESFKKKTQEAIGKLQVYIDTDPEGEILDLELPDSKYAPKRTIKKHVRITKFPKVLAIHLSRSIFDASRSTMKNSAKVSFPERLPLGGLLTQRTYKLLSVVCHKGSHHSGHYESFRRQNVYAPFSTPNTFQVSEVYSKPPTPNPSQISTPQIQAQKQLEDSSLETSTLSSTPELLSPMSAESTSSLSFTNGRRSGESSRSPHSVSPSTSTSGGTTATKIPGPTSAPRDPETSSIRSVARSAKDSLASRLSSARNRPINESSNSQKRPSDTPNGKDISRNSLSDVVRHRRKKAPSNRWWRISDEKIKEAKTSDVLGMQKEVYMLFYELEKEEDKS